MVRDALRTGSARPAEFRLGELRQRMPQRGTVGLAALWDDVQSASVRGTFGRTVQHVVQALRTLLSSPVNALLTTLSIALVLTLFGLSLAVLDHIWGLLSMQRATLQVSVYLDPEHSQPEQNEFRNSFGLRLRTLPGVANVEFVSRTEALRRFQSALGEQAGALAGLEENNPLPASFEISFAPEAIETIEAVATQIRAAAGVQEVLFDRGVFSVLTDLLRTLSRIAWIVVPLLFGMVAFIIASTVRLALHRHRQEIEVMRLVGARHRYVCAPFLIGAVLQGLFGGVLGVGLLLLVHQVLRSAIGDLGVMGVLGDGSLDLAPWVCVAVISAGVLTGLAGSSATLRRFSAEI